MQIEQVFAAYDHDQYSDVQPKFCADCGASCELRQVAGRERWICPTCGFVHWRNPLPAVSVWVVHEGKVLLGKRSQEGVRPGYWCAPCGFIEHDEDFLTAARRETLEETGLEVSLRSLINVAHNFLPGGLHTVVLVFLADVIGGTAVPGDDLVDLRWFGPDDPLPELAFEADRHIINLYFAGELPEMPLDQRYSG